MIIVHESKELRKLLEEEQYSSEYGIGDEISFLPMHWHSKLYNIKRSPCFGTITAIRFTKAKVFYDIVDDYWGHLFKMVDSSFVSDGDVDNYMELSKVSEHTDPDKISQDEANYRFPHEEEGVKCRTCAHYISIGACGIVSGDTNPEGVCDLWESKNGDHEH